MIGHRHGIQRTRRNSVSMNAGADSTRDNIRDLRSCNHEVFSSIDADL
jgi:hypothetical protein